MGKQTTSGKCRLCLQAKPLVDSHIIPDFHFKPLRQRDGHFLVVSTDPRRKRRRSQRGLTQRLFCATCDNVRLQKNEAHLAHVLFHDKSLTVSRSGSVLTFRGYDYKKVKNGLLSVLWRMSISSRPEFKEVKLGPKHDEIIRSALFNDEPFDEEQYPILVTMLLIEGEHYTEFILSPDVVRLGSNRAYRCVISGILFTFIVGSAPLSEVAKPYILRKNAWPIYVSEAEKIPFLNDAFAKIARGGDARSGV